MFARSLLGWTRVWQIDPAACVIRDPTWRLSYWLLWPKDPARPRSCSIRYHLPSMTALLVPFTRRELWLDFKSISTRIIRLSSVKTMVIENGLTASILPWYLKIYNNGSNIPCCYSYNSLTPSVSNAFLTVKARPHPSEFRDVKNRTKLANCEFVQKVHQTLHNPPPHP